MFYLKHHDATDIFLKIAKELDHYQIDNKNMQYFSIDQQNQNISFTIVDRHANNRLLAAGQIEQTALLFSSVRHEILLESIDNQLHCIVKKQYTLLIEKEDGTLENKESITTAKIKFAEVFISDLSSRLSSIQYYLLQL